MKATRHRAHSRNEIGDRAPTPAFDGYPYLVTLVTNQLYHLAVVPMTLGSLDAYRDIALKQVAANKLQSCLVLAADKAIYVRISGEECWSPVVPSGAIPVIGKLRLARDFSTDHDADLFARVIELRRFVREHSFTGLISGDPTKGGREPTTDEARGLRGKQRNGVPRGLVRCETCADWRGQCFDPDPEWRGLLMTVSCRCANDNVCARCDRPLAAWKLNSNFYDERDGAIWHVPTFSALEHRCGTPAERVHGVSVLNLP